MPKDIRTSIEIRRANSVEDVQVAIDVIDRIFGAHEGWNIARDRSIAAYRADPALLAVAVDKGRVIGAVGTDGASTINVVVVDAYYRGRGIARHLLAEAESTLRERGAHSVGLGSVDDAAGFYLRCGYAPQLLVQFRPEAEDPHRIVDGLLAATLRDHQVFRTEFHGSPQLWIQVDTVDFAFKARIEAVAPGMVAQYIMSKQL